ncbi:MAG: MarR family transcriptional regulator, partial [Lacipirellulaceae bacterium]
METPHLEELLLVALRRITRAISLRSQVLQKEIGLTSPQLAALHAIARLQPVATGKIATELHLGQPTVTGIITRLEQGGFITRTRGASDRRSVAITLTAKGSESLATAPSLLESKFRKELGSLPEWEQGQILS